MTFSWVNRNVLIAIRTYPIPAQKGIEISCTAGITDDGKWIRMFPVPYRFLTEDRRFKKYQWINVNVSRSTSDARPESHKIDLNSIRIGDYISTNKQWIARKERIFHLKRSSFCEIERERDLNQSPTLGIFKPEVINRLVITPSAADWTLGEKTILNQQFLFPPDHQPPPLEKIPYDFKYEFRCPDSSCKGHRLTCTDWEMGESYRKWSDKYRSHWERKFRQTYENDMITKHDTHFFVGTVRSHPNRWIIVGLFYPPLSSMLDLYGSSRS